MQLKARDQTITRLERELKKKTEQYHNALNEMSHTGEMVDSVRSMKYLNLIRKYSLLFHTELKRNNFKNRNDINGIF